MITLTTIIICAVAGLALSVIVIKLLGWQKIKDWFLSYFKNRNRIKSPDEVAFTLKTALSNGNVKVVQGIFNTNTETVEDGVEYNAEKIDNQLSNYHKDNPVVIYNSLLSDKKTV